jgi:hypothetical protein
LAPQGAIGNGSFALHSRAVFLSGIPVFQYRGREEGGGRSTVRFDFQVPQFMSGYRLKVNELEGTSGYRGSFWADPDSLDLVRLDVEAIEIPPHIPLRSAGESMRYRRQTIGASEYLLPESSEMIMEDSYGNRSRNVIGFSQCRQYSGESTLSFADVPEDTATPAPPPPPAPPIEVPAGLFLEIELLTPIRFPGNAVGDQIAGRVRRDVRRKGQTIIPKGASVRGNIAVIGPEKDLRGNALFALAFEWREISFDGRMGAIRANLEDGGAIPSASYSTRDIYARPRKTPDRVTPHRNVFYVRRSTLELPRGLPLFWSAAEADRDGEQRP